MPGDLAVAQDQALLLGAGEEVGWEDRMGAIRAPRSGQDLDSLYCGWRAGHSWQEVLEQGPHPSSLLVGRHNGAPMSSVGQPWMSDIWAMIDEGSWERQPTGNWWCQVQHVPLSL